MGVVIIIAFAGLISVLTPDKDMSDEDLLQTNVSSYLTDGNLTETTYEITSVENSTTVQELSASIAETVEKTTEHSHYFSDATCLRPKTCVYCDETEGEPIEHNFENGKCSFCKTVDPDYEKETMVWIPTNGGQKYHIRSTCSKMIDPDYVTLSEAVSCGFTPCGICY